MQCPFCFVGRGSHSLPVPQPVTARSPPLFLRARRRKAHGCPAAQGRCSPLPGRDAGRGKLRCRAARALRPQRRRVRGGPGQARGRCSRGRPVPAAPRGVSPPPLPAALGPCPGGTRAAAAGPAPGERRWRGPCSRRRSGGSWKVTARRSSPRRCRGRSPKPRRASPCRAPEGGGGRWQLLPVEPRAPAGPPRRRGRGCGRPPRAPGRPRAARRALRGSPRRARSPSAGRARGGRLGEPGVPSECPPPAPSGSAATGGPKKPGCCGEPPAGFGRASPRGRAERAGRGSSGELRAQRRGGRSLGGQRWLRAPLLRGNVEVTSRGPSAR